MAGFAGKCSSNVGLGDQVMRTLKPLLSAVILVASSAASFAGPCTSAVKAMQVKLDARIAATAAAGPFGKESTAAKLSRQPTPESVAAAEARLGEGANLDGATAALNRARAADADGDKAACEQALAEAERELSR